MRRSILDIASVKENITPVQISIVLSPAPTGLQPLGGELPRLNPGLSFQGPSGRHADSSTRPHAHTPTCPADLSSEALAKEEASGVPNDGAKPRLRIA